PIPSTIRYRAQRRHPMRSLSALLLSLALAAGAVHAQEKKKKDDPNAIGDGEAVGRGSCPAEPDERGCTVGRVRQPEGTGLGAEFGCQGAVHVPRDRR